MLGFGSQSIGNLVAHIGADITGLDRGLGRARAKLKQFGTGMSRMGRSMSFMLTAPLILATRSILKTAGNFEAAMNRVQALTGATGDTFMELRDMAKDLGITTQFSASQAASGIEMLAKNGLDARIILDGMLKSSLNLAAATGTNLKSAADIATDALLQFKLTAADTSMIMDGIVNTTINSKFGINDYAFALATAGGVAGQVGVEFDDFNAVLIATASNFKGGRRAGTSFKTFLNRLVPTSKQAKEMMEKLNLQFFTSTGAIKPMVEIAGELNRVFSGMNDEQKILVGQTLFGADAIRTALGLAEQGAEGVAIALAKVKKEGSAIEQAEARMKGFNGALKRFISALEGLKIAIGESGFLKWATDVVEGAANMTRELAAANPEFFMLGLKIAGVVAAIGPALMFFALLASAVAAILSPIGLLVTAIVGGGGLIAGFTLWNIEMKDIPSLLSNVGDTTGRMWDALTAFPISVIQFFKDLRVELAATTEEMKGAGGQSVWEELGLGALKWGERMLAVFSLLSKSFAVMVSRKITVFAALIKFMVNGLTKTGKIIEALGEGSFKKAFDIAKQPAEGLKAELLAISKTTDNSYAKALAEFKEDWKTAGTAPIVVELGPKGKVTPTIGAPTQGKPESPILAPGESATPFSITPLSSGEVDSLLKGMEVGKEASKERDAIMEDGKRLTQEVMTEQEKYNSEIERYGDLIDAGAISTQTYNRAVKQLTGNLKSEAGNFQKLWTDAFQVIESSASGFFFNILQGQENSFEKLLNSFKSMMDRIVSEFIAKQLMMALVGEQGGASNNIGGYIGTGLKLWAGADSSAPVTGPGESATELNFDKYHTGGIVGLGSNEIPIVAQRGEGVFTERQMKNMAPAGNPVTVNMNIQTPDIAGFQHPRAQGQLQRDIAISVDAGRRET